MSSTLTDDARIRRRLWFTGHVLLYCAAALLQVLVWPAQPLLLAAQSALLMTVILHLYGLYSAGFASVALEPVPIKVQTSEPQPVRVSSGDPADSFWYRWHDV